jgi:CubicO group peptidase (beta-lactamase class C family)
MNREKSVLSCPTSGLSSLARAAGFAFALLLAGAPRAQEPNKPAPRPAAISIPSTTNSVRELTAVDLEAFLDGLMPAQLEREDIAGAVVAVVKDGSVLLEKGYGFSDVEKRKSVSPTDTLFRPGSIRNCLPGLP